MSTSWPLRLSCMAVMAPALSDAVRHSVHSSFKLPPSPPPSESSPEIDRERDCESPIEQGHSTVLPLSPGKLQHLKVLDDIPKLLKKQYLATGSIGLLGNMNVNCHKTHNGLRVGKHTPNGNNNLKSDINFRTSSVVSNQSLDSAYVVPTASVVSPPIEENRTDSDDQSDLGILKSFVSDKASDVSKKQKYLERKASRLQRRIQRLQAMQCEVHTRDQIAKFVVNQKSYLLSSTKTARTANPSAKLDYHAELLQSEDVKNLSTAALVSLVRKLESANCSQMRKKYDRSRVRDGNEQTTISLGDELCDEISRVSSSLEASVAHVQQGTDSDATESSSGGESCDEDVFDRTQTQNTPLYRRASWKWSVERSGIASRWTWLQAQVSDLEYRIRQQNDIYRQIRATKGPVILGDNLAEESLLRIRNLSKAKRQSSTAEAKTKNLDRSPLGDSSTSQLSSLFGSNRNKVSGSAQKKSVNGYIECEQNNSESGIQSTRPLLSVSDTSNSPALLLNLPSVPIVQNSADDSSCCAARTRPLRSYRKRKLLKSAGVHNINRKAARLSTVKCGCCPPVTPCVMCGGRYNNFQNLDPETMHLPERVALLDHSYHQVLSFNQEIPLHIQFETLLKTGEWQTKSSTAKQTTSNSTVYKKTKLKEKAHSHRTKRLKNAAAILLSNAKIRSNLTENYTKHYTRLQALSLPTTPTAPKNSVNAKTRLCKSESRDRKQRTATRSAPTSASKKREKRSLSLPEKPSGKTPLPSPPLSRNVSVASDLSSVSGLKSEHGKDSARKLAVRKTDNAFDINNIVIPESMAASARIVKLQYKEIVTPKWRVVDEAYFPTELRSIKFNDTLKQTSTQLADGTGTADEQDEEISDEAVASRHLKCEIAEKAKFMSYVHLGGAPSRQRAQRSDSVSSLSSQVSPDAVGSSLSSIPLTSESLASPPISAPVQKLQEEMTIQTRRRSGSIPRWESSRTSLCDEDTQDSLSVFSPSPAVAPYPPRVFPLPDKEFDQMVAQNPNKESLRALRSPGSSRMHLRSFDSTPQGSRASSELGDEVEEEEDSRDDPEWTIEEKDESSGGIVLKLSKR